MSLSGAAVGDVVRVQGFNEGKKCAQLAGSNLELAIESMLVWVDGV